ncbi:MAG: Ca-activated chloride channel family protein [Bacteroidia bacterium]|jgi:Ca-activated chloride channel family protein
METRNKNTEKGLDHLNQYEPKPAVWDNIETVLNEDDKPKIIYWRWFTGIAATIVLMLAVNWMLKKELDTPLVEVETETQIEVEVKNTVADTTLVEVKMAIPEPVDVRNEAPPTTGPWDGKAGQHPEHTLATAPNVYNVTLDSVSQGFGTVTYQWTFGDSNTTSNGAEHTYSTAVPYLYLNSDVALTGTFDVQTNYSISDNMGYMDQTTSGSYSAPLYQSGEVGKNPSERTTIVDAQRVQNVEVDQIKKSFDSQDIVYLGQRSDESYTAGVVNTTRAKMNLQNSVGNKSRSSNKPPSPGIPVPSKRVLENEKYQCVVVDSIAGFYNNGADNYREPVNTESYFPLVENEYLTPTQEPLSTFGIDVDNASYTVMRSKINSNQIVPKDAVRIEEFVNYFDYNYQEPTTGEPFSINLENAACPWNAKHQLIRIGLKGKDINYNELQKSNLVFLIDVSGSMDAENKLPLVKKSMKLLVDQMGPKDRIAVVTYAGAAGLALESTSCSNKDFIKKKIDKLDAGGSTAGGEGIKLAYNIALQNLVPDGNNRVIMCTDGDFNVGQSSDTEMKNLIINNRNKGIFITACGFGMGNYQDSKMETIADNGNGNYFYIDSYRESEKVFNREIRATLFTIAKDVKIQVEFNPKHVKAYRLIGYENRKMPPQDFNDDTKDGGELGAGHTVTALYEIIPATSDEAVPGNIELKYQKPVTTEASAFGDELLTIKLRYKQPNGSVSMLLEKSLGIGSQSFEQASLDFQFATGVALYAQQLRQSKFIDQEDFKLASSIIKNALGSDVNGDRKELLTLIKKASNTYQVYTKE